MNLPKFKDMEVKNNYNNDNFNMTEFTAKTTYVALHKSIVARRNNCVVRPKNLAIRENSYCISTTKYWPRETFKDVSDTLQTDFTFI